MNLGNFYSRLIKYLDRGKLHFGNLQMPLTVIVALGVYRDTKFGAWIFEYSAITIPAIIILFYLVLIVIGKYEYKYGLIKKQMQIDNDNNLMLQKILEELRKK